MPENQKPFIKKSTHISSAAYFYGIASGFKLNFILRLGDH